jgi:hypothetical protein
MFAFGSRDIEMRTKRGVSSSCLGLLLAVLLLAAMPLPAHHWLQGQYDESQPVMLDGTVSKITWKNPHVLLSLEVKEQRGEVARWEFELASPNGLMSRGWKLDSFKRGDRVIVNGYRAKNGSHLAIATKVTLAAH